MTNKLANDFQQRLLNLLRGEVEVLVGWRSVEVTEDKPISMLVETDKGLVMWNVVSFELAGSIPAVIKSKVTKRSTRVKAIACYGWFDGEVPCLSHIRYEFRGGRMFHAGDCYQINSTLVEAFIDS
jgi:hypothetical protein